MKLICILISLTIGVTANKKCKTWNGYTCKFPFTYGYNHYNICTQEDSIDYRTPWCYLVEGYWDYCTRECFENGVSNDVPESCIPVHKGKESTATQTKFPWHAFIKNRYNDRTVCNGVILSYKCVLTSATCVKELKLSHHYVMVGGNSRFISSGFQQSLINWINIHPGYNETEFKNDLAVVYLRRHFIINNRVLPIALPMVGKPTNPPSLRMFTGSGIFSSSNYYDGIHYSVVMELNYYNHRVCNRTDTLCTTRNSINNRKDRGGPITKCEENTRCILVGILSQIPKEHHIKYLIFVNITHFLPWINNTLS